MREIAAQTAFQESLELLGRGKTRDPSTPFYFGRDDASIFISQGDGNCLRNQPDCDISLLVGNWLMSSVPTTRVDFGQGPALESFRVGSSVRISVIIISIIPVNSG
jgi:hypothetical protein